MTISPLSLEPAQCGTVDHELGAFAAEPADSIFGQFACSCAILRTVSPLDTIRAEARESRTVLLTAREADGSVETREIEPYSLRSGAKDRPEQRLFYYSLKKDGTRNTYLSNILSADVTGHSFEPRWPVEL